MSFFRLCRKEGSNLSNCSKCKVAHYCSRACQVNDWCTHKYACNLTSDSHKDIVFVLHNAVSNDTYLNLIKSIVYHFLLDSADMSLLCVLSFGDGYYKCSFIVNPLPENTIVKENERLVWIICHDGNQNTSEGGFRFTLEECKLSFDILSSKMPFENVKTEIDIPLGGEVEFNVEEINKHIHCSFTNHCMLIMANGKECILIFLILLFLTHKGLKSEKSL